MQRKMFFLALILANIAMPLNLLSTEQQVTESLEQEIIEVTLDEFDVLMQDEIVTKGNIMTRGDVSARIKATDTKKDFSVDEELFEDFDLDGFLGELDPNLLEDPTEGDNPEDQMGTWQALKLFWALPFNTKKQLIANHMSEHKTEYILGTAGGSALGIGVVVVIIRYLIPYLIQARRKK